MASTYTGTGTSTDPYIFDDLSDVSSQDIYDMLRGSGFGDTASAGTFFQLTAPASRNGQTLTVSIDGTPNTGADWELFGGNSSTSATYRSENFNSDEDFTTSELSTNDVLWWRVFPYNNVARNNLTGLTMTLDWSGEETVTSTVTLALTPDTIGENGGSSSVTATVDPASSDAFTVDISITPTDGADDSDFTLSSNATLSFAADAATSTGAVTVTAVNNDIDAPDKILTVSGTPSSTEITAPSTISLTITDDDAEPTASLVLDTTSITEAGGVATVTATQDRGSSEDTTITISVTPVSPATTSDYTLSSNTTLTIAAGDTTSTGTVTITAVDNTDEDPSITVTVSGSAANSQGITDPDDVTLTITNDDAVVLPDAAAPTVTIGSVSSVDENSTLSLSATVSGGTYDTLTYAWTVASGGGSLSGSGASVTYTPPDVVVDTTVTVRCTVTATGTGTNALSGTSDTATDTESFTVNFVAAPVTPVAAAGNSRFLIEIAPLGGAGAFLDWEEVQEFTLGGMELTQRAERTAWNYGVIRFGDARIRLADPYGKWAPPMFPNSKFAIGGQEGSKFRVRFPSTRGGDIDTTIWRGTITSKASMTGWAKGETLLQARPINSIYKDAVIQGGNIVSGNGITEILTAIYNIKVIDDLFDQHQESLGSPGAVSLTVSDESELTGDGFEVLEVLENILKPLDGLVSYDMNGNVPLIFTRGTMPDGYGTVALDHVIDIMEVSMGVEQVFNEIVVETGLTGNDETVTEQNTLSIEQFGLRSTTINLKWVKSRDVAISVAKYLLSRLSYPRQMLKVLVDAWAIPPANVFVGQHLELNLHQNTPERTGWGQGGYSKLRLKPNRIPSFSGTWYIEVAKWKLDDDTIELTLREVR